MGKLSKIAKAALIRFKQLHCTFGPLALLVSSLMLLLGVLTFLFP